MKLKKTFFIIFKELPLNQIKQIFFGNESLTLNLGSPLNCNAKFLIFLPKEDMFTKLYVKYVYKLVLHNEVKETLNKIRKSPNNLIL